MQGGLLTWGTFESEINKQFKPVNNKQIAWDKMNRLVQTKSVQHLVEQFRTLLDDIGDIPDSVAIELFKRKLKPNIREKVDGEKEFTELNDIIQFAQRKDALSYYAYGVNHYNTKNGRDEAPMQLDNMVMQDGNDNNYSGVNETVAAVYNSRNPRRNNPNPRLPQDVFKYCMENKLCLRCKEPGHLSRGCIKPIKPLKL